MRAREFDRGCPHRLFADCDRTGHGDSVGMGEAQEPPRHAERGGHLCAAPVECDGGRPGGCGTHFDIGERDIIAPSGAECLEYGLLGGKARGQAARPVWPLAHSGKLARSKASAEKERRLVRVHREKARYLDNIQPMAN